MGALSAAQRQKKSLNVASRSRDMNCDRATSQPPETLASVSKNISILVSSTIQVSVSTVWTSTWSLPDPDTTSVTAEKRRPESAFNIVLSNPTDKDGSRPNTTASSSPANN